MPSSATSTCLLNTCRNGDATTSLGSLFQCLATLAVETFFPVSHLNLPRCSLRPFPLSLVTWEKRPTPTSLQPPFRQLQRARRSLLNTGVTVQPRRGPASWLSLPAAWQHPSASLQRLRTTSSAVGTGHRGVIHSRAAGGAALQPAFKTPAFHLFGLVPRHRF